MKSFDWENPSITGKNKLPPHSHRNYPEKIVLNGIWSFGGFNTAETIDCFTNVELPNQMEVPFHPELKGFDIPIYTNIQYPFPPNPPFVPHKENLVSIYQREFEIPETCFNELCV